MKGSERTERPQSLHDFIRRWRWRSWERYEGGARRRVHWDHVAATLGAMALGGWLLATVAWYGWLRVQHKGAAVSYVDLLLYPWRADEHRAAMGDHFIAQGRRDLEAGRFVDAERNLRVGLEGAPGDLAARRQLASVQLRLGQPELALETVADPRALAQADLAHLTFTFGWLHGLQRDDLIGRLAKQALPAAPDRQEKNRYIALQAAIARYERNDYAAARRMVEAWGLADSADGQLLLARCDWESESPRAAIERLKEQLGRFPDGQLAAYLVTLLRESGDLAEARRLALSRRSERPQAAERRIDLLRVYRAAGAAAEFEREVQDYLDAQGGDVRALEFLAGLARDEGLVPLAVRVRRTAEEHRLPLKTFDVACVEAALVARQWLAAVELAFGAMGRVEAGDERQAALLGGMRAVGFFGAEKNAEGRQALRRLNGWRGLRGAEAVAIARHLVAASAIDPAHDLLVQVAETESGNLAAAAELMSLNVRRDDRAGVREHLPRLLRLRKPSRTVLAAVLQQLNHPAEEALAAQVRSILATLPQTVAPR